MTTIRVTLGLAGGDQATIVYGLKAYGWRWSSRDRRRIRRLKRIAINQVRAALAPYGGRTVSGDVVVEMKTIAFAAKREVFGRYAHLQPGAR